MYKFAIIGTLLIDSKKYTAGPKGLIVESKELADRISEVIGSKYITLEEKPRELTPAEKGAATKRAKAEAKAEMERLSKGENLENTPEEAKLPSED
jgi:hypothetical protein